MTNSCHRTICSSDTEKALNYCVVPDQILKHWGDDKSRSPRTVKQSSSFLQPYWLRSERLFEEVYFLPNVCLTGPLNVKYLYNQNIERLVSFVICLMLYFHVLRLLWELVMEHETRMHYSMAATWYWWLRSLDHDHQVSKKLRLFARIF